MAHHHHHHHREAEEEGESQFPVDYPSNANPGVDSSPYLNPPAEAYGDEYRQQPPAVPKYGREEDRRQEEEHEYERERKQEKKREHFGEAGALAAGAFAMYEAHEVKVDPEHGRIHKFEEEIAEAVGVGAAGYTVYEHHEVKKTERLEKEAEGKKHHHHLF